MSRQTDTRTKPGEPAPAFSLKDTNGNSVTLEEQYRKGPVLLLLLASSATSRANEAAAALRDNMKLLRSLKSGVLAVLPEGIDSMQAFRDAGNINFPLLSDPDGEVLAAWGFPADAQSAGSDGAVYVIDGKGKVRFRQLLAGPEARPDFKAIMQALVSALP